MRNVALLSALAVVSAGAAAQAGPTPSRVAPDTQALLVHEGHAGAVQAMGTVNSVDAAKHTVNLSHGSIRALGWPAMTMDFPVSPEVNLGALRPGMQVSFTLVHGTAGMVVDTIRPAATSSNP